MQMLDLQPVHGKKAVRNSAHGWPSARQPTRTTFGVAYIPLAQSRSRRAQREDELFEKYAAVARINCSRKAWKAGNWWTVFLTTSATLRRMPVNLR